MLAKFVQLLMACAIFNPLCCCTAGMLTTDEVRSTSSEHSCCQSGQSNAPVKTGEDHDPNDCPHKALKEYQVTAQKDLSDTPQAAAPLPLLLTPIEIIHFEPLAQISHRIQLATVSQAPPPAFAQVYCVYRI